MKGIFDVELVDLHCHLLWGIDDGAKGPEDSLAMARALASLGYRHVACSPHAKEEYPSWDRAVCQARLEEAQALLEREDIPLKLYENAENLLDLELPSKIERRARFIGPGPYLLAEAPYFTPLPQLPDLIFRLRMLGVRLVVAHPERCKEFQRPKRAAEAVQAGALLQLDVGALIGRYGRGAKKLARSFLDDGLYAVAATDLHSPRDAEKWVGESIAELARLAGKETAIRLLSKNPASILRGERPEV